MKLRSIQSVFSSIAVSTTILLAMGVATAQELSGVTLKLGSSNNFGATGGWATHPGIYSSAIGNCERIDSWNNEVFCSIFGTIFLQTCRELGKYEGDVAKEWANRKKEQASSQSELAYN